MNSTKRISEVKNYLFPTGQGETNVMHPVPGSKDIKRNLSNYITPVQFMRLRHDVKMWRDAMTEAELAYYPKRVKIMRLFQDTILNGHVFACLERRKNLTLLRDFMICDEKKKPSDDLKSIFRNSNSAIESSEQSSNWFDDFMRYTLEAKDFGYSLISLGDLIDGAFPNLSIVKRQNVSPDRFNVTACVYSLSGYKFLDDPYRDWHIYVNTPSELGVSPCGYGLLYKIALYEILLRNNIGYNADFVEMFNQPFRKGTTTKTEESERSEFESALRDSGSLGYIMLDTAEDDIQFVESSNVGSAHQSYGDFDHRLEQKISKVILGHADAMDSTPGKLGGGQSKGMDEDNSPSGQALADIQTQDGILVQNVINSKLLPRMRKMGFDIPINYHFEFLNDREKQEIRNREDKSNDAMAGIALKLAQAGLQMDPGYFTERTNIPVTQLNITQPNDNNTITQ
jgi:hypothetical protein